MVAPHRSSITIAIRSLMTHVPGPLRPFLRPVASSPQSAEKGGPEANRYRHLLGVSPRQVRRMERGQASYTLAEIELIARATQNAADEIVKSVTN